MRRIYSLKTRINTQVKEREPISETKLPSQLYTSGMCRQRPRTQRANQTASQCQGAWSKYTHCQHVNWCNSVGACVAEFGGVSGVYIYIYICTLLRLFNIYSPPKQKFRLKHVPLHHYEQGMTHLWSSDAFWTLLNRDILLKTNIICFILQSSI